MKVAHVKTVDGTTQMIHFEDDEKRRGFKKWLMSYRLHDLPYKWVEEDETCILFKDKIISVRFKEVK